MTASRFALASFSVLATALCLSGIRASAAPAKSAPPTQAQIDLWQRQADERLHNDWAWLGRYAPDNAKLKAPAPGENRVVFMGDSITDFWINKRPAFFADHPYLDRGISGQTTPQMLVRFRADVIDLHPRVVVILAGTNDIAGNTGPETPAMIEGYFASMVDLAHQNHIRVVLASILPAADYFWHHGVQPAPKIAAMNVWLRAYAAQRGCIYLDYYSAMQDGHGGMRKDLSEDGVHPNGAGYDVMAPLAIKAIEEALARK